MENPANSDGQHFPSFFQNSSPGSSAKEVSATEELYENRIVIGACGPANGDGSFEIVDTVGVDETAEQATVEKDGWLRSLTLLPSFSHEKLDDRLINSPENGAAPKAFRNKKEGYKLWKEGYVRAVFVKPNVKGKRMLFLVKAKISASMKSVQYMVYVHLDQINGDVVHAKCDCKAGQGGCCKHVAALLYTLLDFINIDIKEIPSDITCTKVGQKWHIPSGARNLSSKAFKFRDLVFEKAEETKKRKRPLVTGSRDTYCATPQFALETSPDELEGLVERLRLAGKAPMFCEAIESNNYQPCSLFQTSSTRALEKFSGSIFNEQTELHYIHRLFCEVPHDNDVSELQLKEEIIQNIISKVGISVEKSIEICTKTIQQSEEPAWYLERAKRITASIFGKVLNRRPNNYPSSLIKAVLDKNKYCLESMPAPLRWGINNENTAIAKYSEHNPELEVKKCGFIISPKWPWLGGTPDGIIFDNDCPVGGLEVKCPFSKRDMTLEEASLKDRTFFLKLTDAGLKLKEKHAYYYQCQGLVNLLGLEWIDFVVFTLKDFHCERIYKDKSLWKSKMLPSLTVFFVNHILPRL
ncbi:uncharacterized protein LOC135693138 [Rhopilema esculentum]|uniref:uncharacterized protein LOC135693138 n=1 Tax=Rhopilema esculentum TaxID=499914 RepID=UPI0031CE7AA5